MEASEAERLQVETGLGAVDDIGHDSAHDGPKPEPVPAHPRGDDKTAGAAPTVDNGQRIPRHLYLSGPGPPEPQSTEAGKVALYPLEAESDVVEPGLGIQLAAPGGLNGPEQGPGEARGVKAHP